MSAAAAAAAAGRAAAAAARPPLRHTPLTHTHTSRGVRPQPVIVCLFGKCACVCRRFIFGRQQCWSRSRSRSWSWSLVGGSSPPPALTQPSQRAPVSGSVRRRCRCPCACVCGGFSGRGGLRSRQRYDQRLPGPSHRTATTKITIITWTVCQVTSLPPLPSSLRRESAGAQISHVASTKTHTHTRPSSRLDA